MLGLGRLLDLAVRVCPAPSTHVACSDQLQQVAFTVQVMESVLRCYARGAAAAAAAGMPASSLCTAQEEMLQACADALQSACVVSGRYPGSSRTPVQRQQVLLACMSAWLAALCMPLPHERPGAAVISTLTACDKLLASAVVLSTSPGADMWANQQVAAALFLVGRCLLSIAEQLQLCESDPSRLVSWVAASLAPDGQQASVDVGRLLTEYQAFADTLLEVERLAATSSQAAAWQMRNKASVILMVAGGEPLTASSSSSDDDAGGGCSTRSCHAGRATV